MRANSLSKAMNLLDSRRPLQGNDIKSYYVERPDVPLKGMIALLRGSRQPIKLLMTGQHGSGKSTELNRIVEKLGHQFFVVQVSAADIGNPYELTFVDLLLGISNRLFACATDAAVIQTLGLGNTAEKVFGSVYHWWTEYLLGKYIPLPTSLPDLSLGCKTNTIAVELEAKLNRQDATRQAIRERAKEQFSELINHTNRLIETIHKQSKQEVLIIIDDIDKVGTINAQELFLEHTSALTALNAKMLYTFPAKLRHLSNHSILQRSFSIYILPNIKITNRTGVPDKKGQTTLQEIIFRRIEEKLITPKAIEALIQSSGGLVGLLIQLLQEAVINAIGKQRTQVDLSDIEKAITDERAHYQDVLNPYHYDVLQQVLTDKMLVNNKTTSKLLWNQSLLEYSNNDDWWCDVNPIIRPMIGIQRETVERLRELRFKRDTHLKFSGQLRQVFNIQTEILRLTVETTGRPTWIQAVQQLISPENSPKGNSQDVLEALHVLTQDSGFIGQQVQNEAEQWWHLKKQTALYTNATSALSLNHLLSAYKIFTRLSHEAQKREYDYRDECHKTREKLLKQILSSVTKRKLEAEEAFRQCLYDQATRILEEIETNFYQPVESAFPDLGELLNCKGTQLGDLRAAVKKELKETQRIGKIANTLEKGLQQILHNWRRNPTYAQDQILYLELEDPDHECKHIWKQLNQIAERIKSYQESNNQ